MCGNFEWNRKNPNSQHQQLKSQLPTPKEERKERDELERSKMVAISLYRGNLHKVPDVPRRWLMPNHTISLKDFKSLLRKREKALSRLRTTTTTATTSSPNPNSTAEQQHEFVGDANCSKQENLQTTTPPSPQPQPQIQTQITDDIPNDSNDQGGSVPKIDCDVRDDGDGVIGDLQAAKQEQKQLNSAGPVVELDNNVDLLNDREKKKRDLEENLKVLNEKKHNLVQMLKQILSAEEEIKRRSSLQALVRPPVPQQVEATIGSGSNPRQVINRTGPEANCCGDMEGESEDISNQNIHASQSRQMRRTSPASSHLRKPGHSSLQQTAVPHTTRPSLGVNGHTQTTSSMFAGAASSPSCFVPSGLQSHPVNLSPLSVSGTHCSASSPSPAASGGTSVFRDSRVTSPSWN